MPSIADLFITVSSDVGGAISGLTQVDQRLNGTTSAMAGATAAAIPLAAAAAAVGGAFLSSVGEAASFEHQINGIKAVMSPEEVNTFGGAVEELALRLGRDTVFSSTQAAGAIEELIKAGVPLPDILSGAAASALDLASATGVNVEQAAVFASTAMNAFGVSAAELPAIMDTISNVSNATAAAVGDLQLGFSQIGPVASALGLSFDDTATALGIFANAGLRGSDAGTSLKTMLLNLDPSTKAQTAAFKELGLITADGVNQFFDATGSARSMSEIFEVLKNSTAGLTDQQKINLLQTAFGTDAVRAATIAAAQGAAGWDAVTESMERMGGVQVAAAQRNSGLAGAMNSLGGSFEALQIQIGTLFLPILTQLVGMLTGVLNGFMSLDPSIQTVIIAAVGVAGAIAGVVSGMILLTPVLTAASAAFGILVAAASPFLVPILAITAAVAALYIAWQTNFGGIQEVTAEVIAAIQPGLENVARFLGELGAAIGPIAQQLATNLAPAFEAVSVWVGQWLVQIPGAVRALGDFFNSISAIIQLLQSGDFQGGIFGLDEDHPFIEFLFTARNLAMALGDAIGGAIGWIQSFWTALNGGEGGANVGNAFQAIVTGVQNAIGGLAAAVQNPLSVVQNLFGSLVEAIRASCVVAGELFAALVGQLGNITGPLAAAWEGVKTFIGNLFAQIGAIISSVDPWRAFVDATWALGTRIGEAIGNLLGFIGNIPNLILGLGDLWGPLISSAWDIGARLGEAFASFLGFIGESLSNLPAMIASLGDFFGPLVTAAWNVGGRLGEAFGNFLTFIGTALSDIPAMIAGLGDFFGPLVNAAWEVGARLGDAIGNFLGFIGSALSNIPGLIEGLGDLWGPFINGAWELGNRIGDAIQNVLGFIGGAIGGIPAMLEGLGDIFGAVVTAAVNLVQRLGEVLGPVAQVVRDIFGMVPEWFSNVFGGGGGGGGGGVPGPTAPGAPIVSIGTLIISSEAEAEAFLNMVAEAVLASSRRVTAPVAGTNPALP